MSRQKSYFNNNKQIRFPFGIAFHGENLNCDILPIEIIRY